MHRVKNSLLILLAMSAALAGFPALAMKECPKAGMRQEAVQSPCDHCPEAEMQQTQKPKPPCCEDMLCKAQCAAAASASATVLPQAAVRLPTAIRQPARFPALDEADVSAFPDTRERPPRNLL